MDVEKIVNEWAKMQSPRLILSTRTAETIGAYIKEHNLDFTINNLNVAATAVRDQLDWLPEPAPQSPPVDPVPESARTRVSHRREEDYVPKERNAEKEASERAAEKRRWELVDANIRAVADPTYSLQEYRETKERIRREEATAAKQQNTQKKERVLPLTARTDQLQAATKEQVADYLRRRREAGLP